MSFGKKRTTILFLMTAFLLAGSACLFGVDEVVDDDTSGFYSPVDSAYKVVANLQLAYQTKNIDAYEECLHDAFEFKLLETDWDDYDGDGIIDESWGKDLEVYYTGNMFGSPNAETIELTLEGNSESVWYGDPSGETLQLTRSFELKVYYINSQGVQDGYRASGQAVFLCRKNDEGDYQIWQWQDLSET